MTYGFKKLLCWSDVGHMEAMKQPELMPPNIHIQIDHKKRQKNTSRAIFPVSFFFKEIKWISVTAACWVSQLNAFCSVKQKSFHLHSLYMHLDPTYYKPSLSKKPRSGSRRRVSTVSNKRLNSKWPLWQIFTGGAIHLQEMEFCYSIGTLDRKMIIEKCFFFNNF